MKSLTWTAGLTPSASAKVLSSTDIPAKHDRVREYITCPNKRIAKYAQKKKFQPSSDAAAYAKSKAQELGHAVNLGRVGRDFAVIFEQSLEPHAVDENIRQENLEKLRARTHYLDNRTKYFASQSNEELSKLWEGRDALGADECVLLRSAMRKRMGIVPSPPKIASMYVSVVCN